MHKDGFYTKGSVSKSMAGVRLPRSISANQRSDMVRPEETLSISRSFTHLQSRLGMSLLSGYQD